jgi:hypothetical protein
MKKLFEATTTGGVTPGGYNKPVSTVIKRPISITPQSTTGCPCKNLPGKVTCGLCNPRKK